jgi:hydrogenase nickel incorporation protein HypB
MPAPIPHLPSAEAPATPAGLNRNLLSNARVLGVSVVGGPGCGKTTLIDATIDHFRHHANVGAICGDCVTHLDADRVSAHGAHVVQVNTGEGGELAPQDVRDAMGKIDLGRQDLLLIENVGALRGPEPPDLGQHVTALVLSVDAGDDKAERHPGLVKAADVVVLNKTDLLGSVPFDVGAFEHDVRRLNPRAEVIELSALRCDGMKRWHDWLNDRMTEVCMDASHWFG